MMTSTSETSGNKKTSIWKRAILWWFTGHWWVKPIKITALAVIVYNVLAFVLMWCPPVRGVVVDIDSGAPIPGAIVQKMGEGPFLFIYSETPGGARTGGALAQKTTDKEGRFLFPAALAHPTPNGNSWLNVVWPFQWLNTIDLRVWQKQYVGVISLKEGLWWKQDSPPDCENLCRVERFRLPIWGFYYKILLKHPVTEAQWRAKIDSVNLGLDQDSEERRLFTDLTGYLV